MVFLGTGVTPAQLVTSEDIKVSFRQAATVLRRAVRAMPGDPLGMQVGARDVLLTMGLLGVAMQSSAAFADAAAVAMELHQASGSLVDINVEVVGADLVLSVHERAPEAGARGVPLRGGLLQRDAERPLPARRRHGSEIP